MFNKKYQIYLSILLVLTVVFISKSIFALDINSNTEFNSWSYPATEDVKIDGATATFNVGATAHDLTVINGGGLVIGPNRSLTFSGAGYFQGVGVNMDLDPTSALTFGGILEVLGGNTYNFGNLNVGASVTEDWDANFRGRSINFNGNVVIAGNTNFHGPEGVTARLAANKSFSAEYFEIEDYNGQETTFSLAPGSVINSGPSSHGHVWVGFENYDSSTAPATLRVLANNNSVAPATVNAGFGVGLASLGRLVVESNSTLNININDSKGSTYGQGLLYLGTYKSGDLPDFKDPKTNNYQGDFTWSGGTLEIGALSTVNVNQRVYLGSSGEINIAPRGHLNVNGDFYFMRDGIYQVGIDPSGISLITVSGTAHIEEGSIVIIPPELYNSQGTPFFTAGSYSDSTLPISSFHKIRLVGNSLVIDKVSSDDSLVVIAKSGGHGLSQNYVNAGAAIERLVMSSKTPTKLKNTLDRYYQEIFSLAANGDSKADIAFKQIIGEEALMIINVASAAVNSINSIIGDRFLNIHSNRLNAPSSGNLDFFNRVWVSSFGSWAKQKSKNDLFGYKYNVGGVVLGYDREISDAPGLTLGVNAAWSSGKLKNSDGLSAIDVKTFSVGGYGSYVFSNGLFLDGTIGIGFTDNDFDSKQALGGRKTANFDSSSFQVGLDLGYNTKISENLSILPSVGFNYVNIKNDGWRERISSNPHNLVLANWYDDTKVDYIEIPVKLMVKGNFQTENGVILTPEVKVQGIFVADKPNRDLRVGFVGSNDSFTIRGVDSGKNRLVAGAGLKAQITDSLDIFTDYEFETRSSYKAHSAQLGLGVSF
jgi:outer membrane autotransporter protein